MKSSKMKPSRTEIWQSPRRIVVRNLELRLMDVDAGSRSTAVIVDENRRRAKSLQDTVFLHVALLNRCSVQPDISMYRPV